jgi:hypothetical protein
MCVVSAMVSIACARGTGAIRTEADAIAVARWITHVSEPVTILHVEQGAAGDIFEGPLGAVPNDRIAEEKTRRARSAWRIDIRGLVTAPCADSAALSPCGIETFELVLDRETGEILYSRYPG